MNQLLEERLSIVMLRENMNFLDKLNDFQLQLKKYFKEDYSQDEIENALHNMEERYITREFEEQKNIVEFPDDYVF